MTQISDFLSVKEIFFLNLHTKNSVVRGMNFVSPWLWFAYSDPPIRKSELRDVS